MAQSIYTLVGTSGDQLSKPLGGMMLKLLVTVLIVGGGISRAIAVDAHPSTSIASESSGTVERSPLDMAQTNEATAMLRLINQARQQQGLSPLELSSSLSTAAQGHAEDMSAYNYFSHSGRDGSSIGDRAQDAGYAFRTVGENIAAGNTTPNAVFDQWMNSEGHRRNMMNPAFTEMGLGYVLNAPNTAYGHYWVLMLGDR
jgi:uncharacterized protein YkwD